MISTRSVLLILAMATAISPACKDRSTERHAVTPLTQTPPPAVETHPIAMAAERPLPATATENASLATMTHLPASPALDHNQHVTAHDEHAVSPASHTSARAPQARRVAADEAGFRQLIYQMQAKMDGELARANKTIVELQKANAELRQALAAERQQLAELRQRLSSGRSIALQ